MSRERVDFVETFSDLEFDVLFQGRLNLSVPDCFQSTMPYYLKDFCIFECPLLFKQKGKLSNITSMSEYQLLAKAMQKVSIITARNNHRIAVVTSSHSSISGEPFFDVTDNTKFVDRFDIKGDLSHLPSIVANYRYIVVDFKQNTVCAQMLIQLIYFSKRTILVPSTNPRLTKHSEISPFVLQLPENRITNMTFSYLMRHATEQHLQTSASFRFAMNFLSLKRRCANLRHYQSYVLNSTVWKSSFSAESVLNMSASSVSPLSLLKPGGGHHHSRHSRRHHLRATGGADSGDRNGPANLNGASQHGELVTHQNLFVVLSHVDSSYEFTNSSWLKEYDHVIYDRSGGIAMNAEDSNLHFQLVDQRKEKGHDAAIFLRYIITHYHSLPEFVVFARTPSNSSSGSSSYSMDDLHRDVFYLSEIAKELRIENGGFGYLGDRCLRYFDNFSIENHFSLHGYFAQWLEFPSNRWYGTSGAFVVMKSAILRRSLDSYFTLLRLVDYSYNKLPVEARLLDMSWPAVFRSSCVVGNYDDCLLRRVDRCGESVNEETNYTIDISAP